MNLPNQFFGSKFRLNLWITNSKVNWSNCKSGNYEKYRLWNLISSESGDSDSSQYIMWCLQSWCRSCCFKISELTRCRWWWWYGSISQLFGIYIQKISTMGAESYSLSNYFSKIIICCLQTSRKTRKGTFKFKNQNSLIKDQSHKIWGAKASRW